MKRVKRVKHHVPHRGFGVLGISKNLANQGALSQGNLTLAKLYENNGLNPFSARFTNLGPSYAAIGFFSHSAPAGLAVMDKNTQLMEARLDKQSALREKVATRVRNV